MSRMSIFIRLDTSRGLYYAVVALLHHHTDTGTNCQVIQINDLEIDDANAGEMAGHGITEARVLSVLEATPKVFRNRRGRSATHILIGPDSHGIILSIPILPTHVRGRWRPVTAWRSGPTDIARWRKAK